MTLVIRKALSVSVLADKIPMRSCQVNYFSPGFNRTAMVRMIKGQFLVVFDEISSPCLGHLSQGFVATV